MTSSTDPLVSVIIPAYNAERYIAEAIDSVLGQTYSSREIIVVDDGSTDRTAEIVAGYAQTVRLIQQQNRGPAAARNTGIREAHGEFVSFLDADDIWTRENLELQIAFLRRHPDHVLSYGWVRFFSDRPAGDLFETVPCPDKRPTGDVWANLIRDTIWATCAAVLRTSALSQVGVFDEALPIGEDYDLWLRLAAHGKCGYVPYMVAGVRLHPESTTKTSPFVLVPPAVRVIRKHLREQSHLAAKVSAKEVRERIAGCYLSSAVHCLPVHLPGSFLHAALALTLSPKRSSVALLYLRALGRFVLDLPTRRSAASTVKHVRQ